ncbi:hypothetical protein CK501_15100 [Halovibrio salipaludis]|uniref:DUF305 domain-containing protein n=1 Tax=Halovibrio salipaludis TaxID=2032626 RepID=A0A2A2EXD1_9GAMM|nr:hypothetical protein [Halovibrio salipaludis]PAU77045.1 hypothetical protein CK501_15100 [Halovibrio salipaludis]
MNKQLLVLVFGALIAMGTFAAERRQDHGHDSNGMTQGEHMQAMEMHMEAIRNTEDPERRRELMQKHHEAMQAHMKSMKTMDDHGAHEGKPADTGTRMERMERQMHMMQGAMEQMMERQEVD